MEKQQQPVVPPIFIETHNHQINNTPDKKQSPDGNNHKAAIWVAIIGLLGILGLPLVNHCLAPKPEPNECTLLKKQLKQETADLQQIETRLKSGPHNLMLEADSIFHANKIQSINNQLKSIPCE